MSAWHVLAAVAGALALALAFAAQLVRWLRVLQREHYDPSAMFRFLGRWTSPPVASAKSVERLKMTRPVTLSHVLFVALVVAVAIRRDGAAVAVSALYGLTCPRGLTLRARTGALAWTRRARMIAIVAVVASAAIATAGAFSARPWLAAFTLVWAVPLVLDLSARVRAPFERRRADAFVARARERLARVRPRVVAITGSYGKTSTKNHLADLLGPDGGVVATPRSFNNRAGLSRSINENLADGTRVFIAEMGTYGPGEIAELCSWCPPEISVVTALGPVHLERMGTMEVIEAAKFEITTAATTVVINVDDPRLARWATRLGDAGTRVRTAGSTSDAASVRLVAEARAWRLVIDGHDVGAVEPPAGVQATNLACAVAAALELGVAPDALATRLSNVRAVANRANVATAPSGVVVIDDTFNANPASADAALRLLRSLAGVTRRVVVTPGLIELGAEQFRANRRLAQRAATMGAELVAVGRTNAVALAEGYEKPLRRFDTREDAVAWVRAELGAGSAVLYLNDLPDHYP